MCRSMVDIHSATAEIRRGKKEEEEIKKQDKNIMSASATQGVYNEVHTQFDLELLNYAEVSHLK